MIPIDLFTSLVNLIRRGTLTIVGILYGHRILVTGVLTDDSLAYGIAKRAIEEGAEVLLSGAGRGMSLTRRMAKRLGVTTDVIALDVTDEAQVTDSVVTIEA